MPYRLSMGIPMEIIQKFHRHLQFQSEILNISTALWFFKNFSQRLSLKNILITIFLFYRILHKGPFKYYVIKKVGGWVRSNAYVCLQGGWVGLAKCLHNHEILLSSIK